MAQLAKLLAAEPTNPNSMPETHFVGGEKLTPRVCMRTHVNTRTINVVFFFKDQDHLMYLRLLDSPSIENNWRSY